MLAEALSRRTFLQSVGLSFAGLTLGFSSEKSLAALLTEEKPLGFTPNVFLNVAPDGIVTIVCHRSEMGQGIRSTLPSIFADELGADLSRTRVLQGDGDKAYGDQNTDGSTSIRNNYTRLRQQAGVARDMLIAAAAKRWGVAPGTCEARGHAVHHPSTKRSLGFGELALEAAKEKLVDPAQVKLRPNSELAHLRADLPVLDGPAITTGKTIFAADVRVPGMLIAVIARPPVVGSSPARFDKARALAVPGVKFVVPLPTPKKPWNFQPWGGVAVIADNTWAALRGREALGITWKDHPEYVQYDSEAFKTKLTSTVRADGQVLRNVGDVTAALAAAKKTVVAEYHVPSLAHAPMEPPAALARFAKGECEVWTATQDPQRARGEVAKLLGIPEAKVTIHVTLLGGGFGRKSKADFVLEAAFLAKATKKPIRVQWTREDDLHNGYHNTVSMQRLAAGIDSRGKVTAWHHRSAFPPIGSTFGPQPAPGLGDFQQGIADFMLDVPNVRAESGEAAVPVRVGWLRSVYNIFHAFATGSFIDEIAQAKDEDPRDTWLEILGKPRLVSLADLGVPSMKNYGATLEEHPLDVGRMRSVIERVTKQAGWRGRKNGDRAFGLAAHRSFLSYVAVVVALKRDAEGLPRIDEVWMSVDAGTVANLDRARSQMEGAVLFGISLGCHSAITYKKGAVEQSNFDTYRLARMADTPRKINVDILKSEGKPCGIGEPGVPPVAPAIANALFALTNERHRELPLPLRIK